MGGWSSTRRALLKGGALAAGIRAGIAAARRDAGYGRPRSLQFLWQAFRVAAYISMGTPSITSPGTGDVPAWDVVIKQAVASTDEHDLKLVDIAREEESSYGNPLYRRAAARRMRLG